MERVQLLESKLQELTDAFSINTAVFAGGFDAADRRIYTMMRVMNEMYFSPGSIYLKSHEEFIEEQVVDEWLDRGEGLQPVMRTEKYLRAGQTIDWMRYFCEYEVLTALTTFVQNAKMQYASRRTVDDEVEEVVTTTFGGEQGVLQ